MKTETTVEQKQRVSEYHSQELNTRLEKIQTKRSVFEQSHKQDVVNMTSEEAKKRHKQILKELALSQEQILHWIENDCHSNSRMKIMEKNYWSFVRSMKPLWEREISSVSSNH